MSASVNLKAKIVRIRIEEDDGLFLATSPDLKGLLAAEKTLDALQREIPKSIVALYAACGVKVVATMIEDGNDWVAVPVDVARQALEVQSAT
ncbi:MAG TPA: hypothetical protein VGT78_03215 [Rhizomicrobium sp.]|nr:hypothetical protein [Rhizomicrobium sp.]